MGTDGAEASPAGVLSFPIVHKDDMQVVGAGSATVSAHGGLLSIILAQPELRSEGEGAVLSVRVGGERRDVAVGGPARTFDGGTLVRPLVLTDVGAVWLNGPYAIGQELDAVILTPDT